MRIKDLSDVISTIYDRGDKKLILQKSNNLEV
jgi:hypothetical protein